MELVRLNYRSARERIANGDLLFWRPCNMLGSVIAWRTNGPYSHVGSASWSYGVLESHDIIQFEGGRTRNLSIWARKYPGYIDVYTVNSRSYSTYDFISRQRRRMGQDYGWWDVLGVAGKTITYGVGFPWRTRLVDADRECSRFVESLRVVSVNRPAFCSEGVVSDMRAAGFDTLPDLAAWEVTPNLLSTVLSYKFTIV